MAEDSRIIDAADTAYTGTAFYNAFHSALLDGTIIIAAHSPYGNPAQQIGIHDADIADLTLGHSKESHMIQVSIVHVQSADAVTVSVKGACIGCSGCSNGRPLTMIFSR